MAGPESSHSPGAEPPRTDDDALQGDVLVAHLAAALAPHYEVREKLGSGGFGSVYRAVHTNTGQDVAIKVLRRQSSWSTQVAASQVARFEREAELCAGIQHPNIVRLIDKGRTPTDLYYAIYERVPGETLGSLLKREKYLSVDRAAELMGQVLDAVAAAHARGVVHRDLKPGNIMIVSTGPSTHVKVLDFGISTLTLEARDTAFHNVTRSNELLGTPRYSAPEQLRGDVPTTKTDLYAWGLVFLECITGHSPISGTTVAEIYQQHLSPVEIPLPPSLVGHPLGEFLRRVLRKQPGERAGDAAKLYTEFRQLHLGDIVGKLGSDRDIPLETDFSTTTVGPHGRMERRQVTALALVLRLTPLPERVGAPDMLDPILRDQLDLCRDALSRYGGTVTGQLGDQFVALFGYPSASDTDARRAVRTVLELADDVRARSQRLSATHGLSLEFRIGIHTGPVTVFPGQVPLGITPTRALALASVAAANTLLVSPESQRILEPFAEFEAGDPVFVSGAAQPIVTARLVGERRGEALSFRPNQSSAPSLLGRAAELRQLEQLASNRGPTAQAALIVGEAGIGKSRLVREFLTGARERGQSVQECRCLAELRNTALSPILPLLRRVLGLHGTDAQRTSAQLVSALARYELAPARFAPVLCTWLALPLPEGIAPVAMAPYRQREVLLEALGVILSRLGEGEGAILLVEDLHWADPTTLELLGQLLRTPSERAPLLVCTARPEFEPQWGEVALTRVNLDRLSPDAAQQLVFHSWGNGTPSPDVVEAIVSRADGIPLFVEELTRMVEQDSSDLKSIPITLRDSLAGRLDRLGDVRAIAQVASALGREFDGALLLAAAGADEAAVARGLERLIQSRLVYLRRRVAGSTYVFRHALIQDAAYDSMPGEVRKQTHARIAEVLEQQFSGTPFCTPAELSRHHAGAGAFEAAVRHGMTAAQALLDKSSNAEAMAQAAQLAAWLPELPQGLRVDSALRINGIKLQALMSTQGWASANVRELAETSRGLLPTSSSVEHTVSTLFALYMHYHVASDRERCRLVAEELVAFADNLGDEALQSVAATAKGVTFHAEGRYFDAEVWLERARQLYNPERDKHQGPVFGMDCYVWASAQLALVQWGMGRSRRSLELANEAIAWARKLQHIPSLGISLLYISQIYQQANDKPAVQRWTGELLETSKTYGLPAFEGYAAAIASWAAGDLQGVRTIIGILESLNCNLILTYYGSFLADIEAAAGNIPQAIGHVETYLAQCVRLGEHMFEAELSRRRAMLEMGKPAPDLEVVRGSLVRAASLAREQGMARFEAAALQDHQRIFEDSEPQRERLAHLYETVSELNPATMQG
ncbi:TOMM system kinase/cyclase fusion protein [Myxococcus sp. K15C18031901]|uniref:TOMM system kinase/cyclase fusion protein n=1 Tax=Myxococcus dinghuensis TaxID=2906761 RepID=UPI0020A71524|nr:TOMM system kinase/cyclase fusion protein [Myxococcus dinghuensis]MCP3097293.1 TOMM system kinase/cyclase fusion protein [Myxococcus dinghuensis]